MIFHVFTNDVGPNREGYSGFASLKASHHSAALLKAIDKVRCFAPVKVLVIPAKEVPYSFVTGSETDPGGLKPLHDVFFRWGTEVKP
jgi:hypothetical protein